MGELDKTGTVTLQELLVTSLAQTDVLCKLLIEKGVIQLGRSDAANGKVEKLRKVIKEHYGE